MPEEKANHPYVEKRQTHDENFKHNFTVLEVARAFFLHNLPQEALQYLDLSTLTIASNELLPSRYRSVRRADILYSVQDKQGKKGYALLHLEAQNKHDKHMALRVWEYHVAIARAHLKQGFDQVPFILTFVLYNGKKTWTSAKSIAELFSDYDLYSRVSVKPTFLIDLHEKKIEDLITQGASAGPQLMMKANITGDYCDMLDTLFPLLKAHRQVDDQNMDYIIENDRHEPEFILEKLGKFDPAEAKKYKHMFQSAITKGKKEGIKQGIQQGIEQGKKATLEALVKQGMITEAQAQKALKEV